MADPTKKSSPFPIAKVTELPESALRTERPLSPMRKLALPIGVAASLVLAGASVGAYAYASSSKTPATRADSDADRATRSGGSADDDSIFGRVAHATGPLEPSPAPMLAGTSAPSASSSAPIPTPPIPPNPNPPLPPGKPPAPRLDVPSGPAGIQPDPHHPKLGGKPMSTHPTLD